MFFDDVPEPIAYEGPESDNPLAFRWYDADRVVGDRTMAEHLRMAACYWHSFNWPGSDVFGVGTFDRPWLDPGRDPMEAAREKMAAAFEFFGKLGVPHYAFHDYDMAPEGANLAEGSANLDALAEDAAAHMAETGVDLLWGTANLFSHPRYAAGAATNPDPEVFAHAAAQVKQAMDVTHRLGGANYVLWGGREGYETMLNTDLGRELDQMARFLHLVVEHKHAIGFEGALLLEPKPQEPTKHQYDHDTATVAGFLHRHGLQDEFKVNIEGNHATLAGHDFVHEVATAVEAGIFGSIDANTGDDRLGWDTDQFPGSVETMSLVTYHILKGGGFTTGGYMFDTKLRRQSLARVDLFHAHVGAMDTLAKSLLVAHAMLDDGVLEEVVADRYAGWSGQLGSAIHGGEHTLASLHDLVVDGDLRPAAVSGRQEELEGVVHRYIERLA